MQNLGWLEGKNVEYRIVYADSDVEPLGRPGPRTGRAESRRDPGRERAKCPRGAAGHEDDTHRDGGPHERRGQRACRQSGQAGGNITGFTSQQDEVLGKLIGILHEVAPGARRIAILVNENSPTHAAYWAGAQSACAALDLVAQRVVASTPAQLGAAVEQIVRQRSQAIAVTGDAMYFSERAKLQELMQSTRLPVVYGLRDHVVAGGLLSYGYYIAANYRNAAKYVDKILKGAKPADLPVEQATKFDLVINLKTAKALGLTIPQSLLLRADEVIQ